MTHPKAGEWWCPGSWGGRTEAGDTYAGCDGDSSCEVCHGDTMARVLEKRILMEPWATRGVRKQSLVGWSNLMASRFGRPVYLVGGALKDAVPRDIDLRMVLSSSEFEARFGDWRRWNLWTSLPQYADEHRRWHVEMAKMNLQGANWTHLPIDFQVEPLAEAVRFMNESRLRLDDIPDLKPPWED